MPRQKVRVGIAGVGNCASSFVQGLSYYERARSNEAPPGLTNVELGGYHVSDIEISAAFDVHADKVGRDVAHAIFVHPNNTIRFASPLPMGTNVLRGPTFDGIGEYMSAQIMESSDKPVDVARALRESRTDVLVSYLPVGSQRATEYYAEQALEAGCAFVNCIPVFIASNPRWAERFLKCRLPIVGDDVKSQLGATIVHRTLVKLMRDRGVRIDRTYQLNFGGNADFRNMLERGRLASKKISKTQAVTSQFDVPPEPDNVHVGPSDFVPWLSDRKWAHIRLEGTTFGDVPVSLELKLEVWDSPNSAGVVIDAVRCAKLGLDRGIGGPLIGPCSWFMKTPPKQFSDPEARNLTLSFVHNGSKRLAS